MNVTALIGLGVMMVSQAATLARIEPFYSWNTPICWTGFILFADSLVFRARGRSWLRSSPAEFVLLTIASIPLWLVFEFYNLYIDNWYYTGLPEDWTLRMFGYAWSYATIWPAIFEGADLIDIWRSKSWPASPAPPARPALHAPPALRALSIALGVILLVWPLVWPSRYLAAPVWLGFIFLLDPINARLGAESLFSRQASAGSRRLTNLMLSGLLCGLLWEFWNYWAGAKWHYTVPIMENLKLFEMPVPGFLGFAAFALECFTMYVFVRACVNRVLPDRTLRFERSIALS